VSWDWLATNHDVVLAHLVEHVQITLAAVALGCVIAFPIGLAAHRWQRWYPPLLALTQVLYTVPSLALFVLLIGVVGLGQLPVVLGLAVYALVILVRNLVEGLRAVPAAVTDAATAMGVPAPGARPRRRAPTGTAGAGGGAAAGGGVDRVAGQRRRARRLRGLGQLFVHGFQVDNPVEVWAGIVLTAGLALALDAAVLGAGRAAAPWTRAVR
jgi:osmoprotectant transport system permease protein